MKPRIYKNGNGATMTWSPYPLGLQGDYVETVMPRLKGRAAMSSSRRLARHFRTPQNDSWQPRDEDIAAPPLIPLAALRLMRLVFTAFILLSCVRSANGHTQSTALLTLRVEKEHVSGE